MRPASVGPRGAFDRILSAAEAVTAAQTCARYATSAGWANTAGSASTLVVASAICVAESGGQATVYYCNPTGADGFYPPVNCAGAVRPWALAAGQPGLGLDQQRVRVHRQVQRGRRVRDQPGRAELHPVGHLHERGVRQLPERGAGRGGRAAARHGARRRARGLPVPGEVRGQRGRGHRPVRQRRPAAWSGGSLARPSRTARSAWRSRRTAPPRTSGCAAATARSTSSGRRWARVCCATPWPVGACATRAARTCWAPRSTWARAARSARVSGGCR